MLICGDDKASRCWQDADSEMSDNDETEIMMDELLMTPHIGSSNIRGLLPRRTLEPLLEEDSDTCTSSSSATTEKTSSKQVPITTLSNYLLDVPRWVGTFKLLAWCPTSKRVGELGEDCRYRFWHYLSLWAGQRNWRCCWHLFDCCGQHKPRTTIRYASSGQLDDAKDTKVRQLSAHYRGRRRQCPFFQSVQAKYKAVKAAKVQGS